MDPTSALYFHSIFDWYRNVKIMRYYDLDMTMEYELFPATRNYADVLEKGREEGREIARKKYTDAVERDIDKTLSIIRDLNEHKSINEIAAIHKISIQTVEEIQATLKLNTS